MTVLGKDPETARVTFGGAAGAESSVGIVRWFDTATGLHCAEFSRSSAGAADAGGIACRKRDGGWDVLEQEK
jgi:hypothetical protein